jgi:hypothetical protein
VGEAAEEIGDVLTVGALAPEVLQEAVDRGDEDLVLPRQQVEEFQDLFAVLQACVGLGVDLAEPATALGGVGRFQALVEALVAPEALDDVHPDVAGVGRPHHRIPRRLQDVADGDAEAGVAQVTDVEDFVGVRLGVLDHDALGFRGALAVVGTESEHLADQVGGDDVGVEVDVDEAVGGLHLGEAVAPADAGRDRFRELLCARPRRLARLLLGFLLREPFERAGCFEFRYHQIAGDGVANGGGDAPGPGERDRTQIDPACRGCDADLRQRGRDRRLRHLRLARDDAVAARSPGTPRLLTHADRSFGGDFAARQRSIVRMSQEEKDARRVRCAASGAAARLCHTDKRRTIAVSVGAGYGRMRGGFRVSVIHFERGDTASSHCLDCCPVSGNVASGLVGSETQVFDEQSHLTFDLMRIDSGGIDFNHVGNV